MRILLDSHAFVWSLRGDPRCSLAARKAVEASDAAVSVSAASTWEIATKVRSGRWPDAAGIAAEIETILVANGFAALAIGSEHARVAGSLPGTHRDPFDRMLAAQAFVEDVPLVTADPAFRDFDVRVLW
jgi:PIN domain nuclease of toxin-antitoxin system